MAASKDKTVDTKTAIEALEKLFIGDPDMQRLEELQDKFNIFEVLGNVRQETRHSDFLAYLLDPNQSHGLGTDFVAKFLQKSLVGANEEGLPISALELHTLDLSDLKVMREWQHIDLFLWSERNQLAIVIENKILSSEHSGQLKRYRKIVETQFANSRMLFLFLTPEESTPSDNFYLPIGYRHVCEIIESLANRHSSVIGAEVMMSMTHYAEMLRRHVVSGSEVERLCQDLYKRHRFALDLIFEYRPDIQGAIHELLDEMVRSTEGILVDHSTKSYVGFVPASWDTKDLLVSEGWTDSKRILMFEFANSKSSLKLTLTIGPGPLEVRQRLLDMTKANEPPFKSAFKALNVKWNNVLSVPVLTKKDYDQPDIEDLERKIAKFWSDFLVRSLPKMTEVLRNEGFLPKGAA